METLRALAARHHAFVASDNDFQRRARVLQAMWRQSAGLPIGEHRGRPLGSRLAMPIAEEKLLNFLSDTTREVVRREVLDPIRSRHKLFAEPRIFDDLLSSQPMALNLFAELRMDLKIATRACRALTQGRVHEVTAIEFEHSPGRGDLRYSGDRSAFDVYVEFLGPTGKRGFVGIEVKYHEGLGDKPAPHRARYDEVAAEMSVFRPEARDALSGKPLQQIWRDHLLAGSLLLDRAAGFDDAFFVFLHPRENDRCARAVELYRSCLSDASTFTSWTLEDVVAAIEHASAGAWIGAFRSRYLAFGAIDDLLA